MGSKNISFVDLSSNSLAGVIPFSFGTEELLSLEELNLSNEFLSGGRNSGVFVLSSFHQTQTLYLDGNQFSGHLKLIDLTLFPLTDFT